MSTANRMGRSVTSRVAARKARATAGLTPGSTIRAAESPTKRALLEEPSMVEIQAQAWGASFTSRPGAGCASAGPGRKAARAAASRAVTCQHVAATPIGPG